jgi:hypothetical protein
VIGSYVAGVLGGRLSKKYCLTDLRHRNLRTIGFSSAYSARKRP